MTFLSLRFFFVALQLHFFFFFFFFSSRRRHTRCSRDWSSDVCSSDLQGERVAGRSGENAEELALAGFPDIARLERQPSTRERLALRLVEDRRARRVGGDRKSVV